MKKIALLFLVSVNSLVAMDAKLRFIIKQPERLQEMFKEKSQALNYHYNRFTDAASIQGSPASACADCLTCCCVGCSASAGTAALVLTSIANDGNPTVIALALGCATWSGMSYLFAEKLSHDKNKKKRD